MTALRLFKNGVIDEDVLDERLVNGALSIVEIHDAMAFFASPGTADQEADHSYADQLLCAALKWLIREIPRRELRSYSEAILANYEGVEKWYA
jgi:hypothetical protein